MAYLRVQKVRFLNWSNRTPGASELSVSIFSQVLLTIKAFEICQQKKYVRPVQILPNFENKNI